MNKNSWNRVNLNLNYDRFQGIVSQNQGDNLLTRKHLHICSFMLKVMERRKPIAYWKGKGGLKDSLEIKELSLAIFLDIKGI